MFGPEVYKLLTKPNRLRIVLDMKTKNPHAVAMGRLGGKAKGVCKARSSEQCRAAVMTRWNKVREAKEVRDAVVK